MRRQATAAAVDLSARLTAPGDVPDFLLPPVSTMAQVSQTAAGAATHEVRVARTSHPPGRSLMSSQTAAAVATMMPAQRSIEP